jgi:hypothetical protein
MSPSLVKPSSISRFRVEDWMACGPALETREDWLLWSRGVINHEDDKFREAVKLPAMLRRRISTIGQMAFRASCALSEQRTARFIFSSRHGEFDRTLRILNSLAAGEAISPADFSLSVHNALAGLLSIAWGNTAGHSAVAAGADSFGYGLLESIACLGAGTGDPVMLVYFDDLLPHPYDEVDDGADTRVALALLLGPPRFDSDDFGLQMGPRIRAGYPPSATAQAFDFIRFVLSGERERTSIGERTAWRWQRYA